MQAICGERAPQLFEHGCRRSDAVRQQQTYRLVAQPPDRVHKRGNRRRVELLGIVHRHEDRARPGEDPEGAEQRDPDCVLFRRSGCRSLEQEREP